MLPLIDAPISLKGCRFPPDVIRYAVWLYYRFPLSLRMVEAILAARGIELTYGTALCWAVKFGLAVARRPHFVGDGTRRQVVRG